MSGSEHKTPDEVAEEAAEEWDYRTGQGQFGQDMDVSIPCQLRFIEETDQRTERFHQMLEVHGYTPLDPDADESGETPYYDGEICSKENYNRIRILVFRGGAIRIYPKDGHVPPTDELAHIIHALKGGFRADVRHDPIEQESRETNALSTADSDQ